MNKLSKEHAVILTGFTGILFGSFSDFHEDVEKRIGHPVWTHQFPDLIKSGEIKSLYKIDFLEIQPEISDEKII